MDQILKLYPPISLDMMNEVKLQNRFDLKFVLHISQLQSILKEIVADYFVLKISGTSVQHYQSVYYDTNGNLFYLAHHNGQAGRIKVRRREYIGSALCYTETKFKSNKGKTSKRRITSSDVNSGFSNNDKQFLESQLFISPEFLEPKIKNMFNRITLVSRRFDERCTIDFYISFESGSSCIDLPKLVIIELKKGDLKQHSALGDALQRHKIHPSGFSKYCIGRALTEPHLKQNRFKSRILKIKKLYPPEVKQLTAEKSFIA